MGTPAPRLGVVVAHESQTVRRILGRAVGGSGEAEVVGEASNCREALERVGALEPDLVLLDIEMPGLDGRCTLELLVTAYPDLAVAMTAAVAAAEPTMKALALGAIEVIQKPAAGEDAPEALERRVSRALAAARAARGSLPGEVRSVEPVARGAAFGLVAIAVSTGGPRALSELLPRLPADLGCPVLVVQHMGAGFTESLAQGLSRRCRLRVREAASGERVEPGQVLLAPGGRHMAVVPGGRGKRARIEISDGPQENGCRPAANVLFRSIAESFDERTLAVVMTGMGRDGLDGVRALERRGGYCIAQDEASSVVYGMPRLVAQAGLAHEVVGLGELAGRIEAVVRGPRRDVR